MGYIWSYQLDLFFVIHLKVLIIPQPLKINSLLCLNLSPLCIPSIVIREYLMTTDYCCRYGSMMSSKQVLPGDLADPWPQLTLVSFLLHTIASQNQPFVHKTSITKWRNKINITDSTMFLARSPQRQLWTKHSYMSFSSLFFEQMQNCCSDVARQDQLHDQHFKVSP